MIRFAKKLNILVIIGLFAVLAGFSQTAFAAIQFVGSVNSTEVITDPANGNKKVLFGLSTGGQLQVAVYADDVARVQFHWDGIWVKEDVAIAKPFGSWDSTSTTLSDEGNVYRITTPKLEIEVVKSPSVQVHFKSPQGFYLSRDSHIEYNTSYDAVADSSYNNLRYEHTMPYGFKLKGIREMPQGEAYFGLGEVADKANRRGQNIQGWNEDTFRWEEGWNPMYMTMPFFYGTRASMGSTPAYAYGLFFNNPARPTFRMGTDGLNDQKYSFEAGDGQLDYFFFGGGDGHTMAKVLDRYTELTGRATMLPKWAYGYHLSRWSFNNQQWVEWLTDEFRAQDIPLDTIYLDLDYFDVDANEYYEDGTLHQLTFNYRFGDVNGMINHAANNGVKLVPLIEPWLSTGDPKWSEAYNQFHFLKDYNYNQLVTPIFFGSVSWLDFSSSSARSWWKGKLVNFLNQYPLAGIWNDLNEPADSGGIPRNGQYWMDGRYPDQFDSRHFHLNEKNMYCVRETSLTYEALLEKNSSKRPFVLSRAGWPGIQRYALGWSGDNVASWNHCRHNIGLGVSVMISGQANFGHDVGGFVGNPSGELNTRWHEWAAFTPFFRSHSIGRDGNEEREPWRYGSYYGGLMKEVIKKRYRFMPYLYTLAHQATVDGMVMNTPTVMHFMDDPSTHYQNDTDFMIGSHLLASPVYNQGQNDKWTYLPKGTFWYNWYNDAKVDGGNWASQSAPLGTLPLWVRAGAIIPMGPSMAFANQFKPDFMDIRMWPNPVGHSSDFTLYEDDGETWHFLVGAKAETRFVSSTTASNITIVIEDRIGSYDTGARDYYLKMNDVDAPTSVLVNGSAIPYDETHSLGTCYSYDAGTRRIVIKVPDSRGETVVVINSIPGYTPLTWIGQVDNWPTNGAINPTDNLWVNMQSYPQDAVDVAEVIYSTNSGASWLTVEMDANGTSGQNDKWHKQLGTFAFGTPVWYWVKAADAQGLTLTNDNGGAYYKLTVGIYGPEITWIGDSSNWPLNGAIDDTDNFWVNTYTYPQVAAQDAKVLVSTNEGASWVTNSMVLAGQDGQDDWWHLNLGQFSFGTELWYWMKASDAYGNTKLDNNDNDFYRVTVGVLGPAIVWAGNSEQYPANGSVDPEDSFWLNVESYPIDSGARAEALISTNFGVTWTTNAMNLAGQRGANDWWNLNNGTFALNTPIWYTMRVTDDYGTVKVIDNAGQPFKTFVGDAGPELIWAGHIDQYPANNLSPSDSLWLNVESYPKQAAVSAKVFYLVQPYGTEAIMQPMNLAGARGNNDWWNINLGTWGSANSISYYFEITDAYGNTKRVPETGANTAIISQ